LKRVNGLSLSIFEVLVRSFYFLLLVGLLPLLLEQVDAKIQFDLVFWMAFIILLRSDLLELLGRLATIEFN
jgi:hypothetical protein